MTTVWASPRTCLGICVVRVSHFDDHSASHAFRRFAVYDVLLGVSHIVLLKIWRKRRYYRRLPERRPGPKLRHCTGRVLAPGL